MSAPNRLMIDLKAVARNVTTLKAHLPPQTEIMAMVKASAYGTDGEQFTRFLERCGLSFFGLSHVHEAVQLRRSGCLSKIFAIHGTADERFEIVQNGLCVGVDHLEVCVALDEEARRQGVQVPVHLHVNTGMQRFGVALQEVVPLAKQIASLPGLILEGVFTHFVAAEDPSFDAVTEEQVTLFQVALSLLKEAKLQPKLIHAANSAGAIRFPLSFCNCARIGLALFGLTSHPIEQRSIDLSPALTLQSKVVGITRCRLGDRVGYGGIYRVTQDNARIATVGIGYHDGVHLHYGEKAYGVIRGQRVPLIGKICMDFLMVDATSVPDLQIGDPILLFGKGGLSPEEWAALGHTNVRELITCLGPRVKREFYE